MKEDNELKYCCDSFKFFATADKSSTPNIRIMKMSENFMKGETKKPYKNNSLRFMLSVGYTDQFNKLTAVNNSIKYCPFCGVSLYRYYKDSRYANEIEGITFNL